MPKAVFTQGSTLKHIIVMTSANAVGLITLFTVDLVDMYFLSLLGQVELAAAIGYSGTLLFFLTSVSIGLQIAMGALVSRSEGSRDREGTARYSSNILVFSLLFSSGICLPAWFYLPELLGLLGATGKTLDLSLSYCNILLPSTPLLAVGMCCAAALRAVGDARRSMYATIGAALTNAALDPLFIFTFGLGIEGAALASLVARVALLGIAMSALIGKHRLPSRFQWHLLRQDLPAIFRVAGPAMMTNLATPIGSSVVLKTMSGFGDSAVAGAAILGRVAPVAFAALFALSGAIGPIIGQNAGAGHYDRVRSTLLNAVMSSVVYTLLVWLGLYLMTDSIIAAFDAKGDAAYLIAFYCQWLAGGFVFGGMLFVANASFNNLEKAHLATLFNFGRSVLGTIPLVYFFSRWYGAPGVMAGEVLGAVIFGILAFAMVLYQVRVMDRKHKRVHSHPEDVISDSAPLPYSSQQSQLGQKNVQWDVE
jgi:putative MATE family efflux protein